MAGYAFHDTYEKCFAGKRILVTGAGKGLGYAIAKRFHDHGAMVFALDKNREYLDALVKECHNVTPVVVDLRDWEKTRSFLKAIEPLDHLINNAAISQASHFLDIKQEQIDDLFNMNFKAVVNVSQCVVQGMIKAGRTQGCTIVNISSVFDSTPSKGLSMYSCTKAAILMLTKSMALELGEHGIRVNAISPAPTTVVREMFVSGSEEIVQETQKVLERQVMRRPVQPNEVADMVLFLSSPSAGMITGTSVPVDGGIMSR